MWCRRYWHIKPTGPQIYPKPFATNGVVGVLWSTQVRALSSPLHRMPAHGSVHLFLDHLPQLASPIYTGEFVCQRGYCMVHAMYLLM